METTIDLTPIILAVMTLIGALVSYRLVPYIKTQTTEKEFEELKMWVKIAVQAAEMLFKEAGLGAEKKQYVIEFLESHGFAIDSEAIDALIESAVLELKRGEQ